MRYEYHENEKRSGPARSRNAKKENRALFYLQIEFPEYASTLPAQTNDAQQKQSDESGGKTPRPSSQSCCSHRQSSWGHVQRLRQTVQWHPGFEAALHDQAQAQQNSQQGPEKC